MKKLNKNRTVGGTLVLDRVCEQDETREHV